MGLISPADQERLRESFADLTRSVRLRFFTQTLGSETCVQTRQILDELPILSDRISVEEVNYVLEPDKAKPYGIDRVPAIAILYEDDEHEAERGERPRPAPSDESRGAASGGGAPRALDEADPAKRVQGAGVPGVIKDSRIRFVGVPAGYEFVSLVEAVLLAGGRESSLSAENRKRVAAVDRPVVMQVFTTPT
jgi:hypothetical protein